MYQAEPVYEFNKGHGYVLNSTTTRNYKKIFGEEASNYQLISKDEAKGLWQTEVATLPQTKTETFHILHGKLIGLWDEITNKGDELASIKQLITRDGERVIGALVPRDKVETILQAFTERNTVADPVKKFKTLVKDNDLRLGAGTYIETNRMQNQNYFRIHPGSRQVGSEIAQSPDIPSIYNYGSPVAYIPNDPIKGPQALAALYEILGWKVKRAGEEAIESRRAEATRRSADALARLRQREGGYVNIDLLVPDFMVIAVEKLAQGIKTFKPFADEMIKMFGDKFKNIRKALRPAWEMAVRFWSDERGMVTADFSRLPDNPTPSRKEREAIGVPENFDLQDYVKKALRAIKVRDLNEAATQAAYNKLDAVAMAIYQNNGRAFIEARRALAEALTEEKASVKTWKGAKQFGLETINAPRTIKASLDFSAPLRQGGIFTLNLFNLQPTRTSEQIRNWQKMFSSMGDQAYLDFEAQFAAHPSAKLADAADLYRASATELDFDARLTGREEQYLSRITDAKLMKAFKYSERAYKVFLDNQRMETFARLSKPLIEAGHATEFPSFSEWRKANKAYEKLHGYEATQ